MQRYKKEAIGDVIASSHRPVRCWGSSPGADAAPSRAIGGGVGASVDIVLPGVALLRVDMLRGCESAREGVPREAKGVRKWPEDSGSKGGASGMGENKRGGKSWSVIRGVVAILTRAVAKQN